jgi:hypothetical protein
VDHDGLAKNLLERGLSDAALGKREQALTSLERAGQEARLGDIYGRVDEETIQAVEKALADVRSNAVLLVDTATSDTPSSRSP